MHFKLLSELDSRELRTVFRRVGKRGEFCESQAIVELTIFLVKIGQDPFLYRFPISESIDKAEASGVKEIQAAKDATEPKNAAEVYASGVAESVLVSGVKEVQDVKDATKPKNATGVYASGLAESVQVKNVSESGHLENVKADYDESEDKPDLDGGSSISETKPASESSVCRTNSASFLFVRSFTASSYECLGCSYSIVMKKTKVWLMNLHRVHWPPDSF